MLDFFALPPAYVAPERGPDLAAIEAAIADLRFVAWRAAARAAGAPSA